MTARIGPTAMTDAEKQARRRAKKTRQGLAKLELWVPAHQKDDIIALVARAVETHKNPDTLAADAPECKAQYLAERGGGLARPYSPAIILPGKVG